MFTYIISFTSFQKKLPILKHQQVNDGHTIDKYTSLPKSRHNKPYKDKQNLHLKKA